MPHRREAAHNLAAMLGPRARVADIDKFTAGLEGMGVVFDVPTPAEPATGQLPAATSADLRDNQVALPIDRALVSDFPRLAAWPLHEVDAELRKINFCIARVK